LWADRDLELRESAADVVVRTLGQRLAAGEGDLLEANVPDGGLFARGSRTAVTVYPSNHVLWLPTAARVKKTNEQHLPKRRARNLSRQKIGSLELTPFSPAVRILPCRPARSCA
jgi:hypothetical protein